MKQIGQPNQGSQQIGQMLLAMSEVMVEMITVIFEDLVVFVLDFPAGTACGDYLRHVIVGNRMRRCSGVAENHLAFGLGQRQFAPIDHQGVITCRVAFPTDHQVLVAIT